MTTWQWLSLMGIALVHTAALFRWGGRIDELIREHDKEITALRAAKHDHGNRITAHSGEIENLKADMDELHRRRGR